MERGGELVIRLAPRRGCNWFGGSVLMLLVIAGFLGLWPCAAWHVGRDAVRRGLPAEGMWLISVAGVLWVAFLIWILPRAIAFLFRGLEVRVGCDRLSTRIDPMVQEIQYVAGQIRNLRLAEPVPPGWAGPEDEGWIVFEYCGETRRTCRDISEEQARYVFEAIVSRLGAAVSAQERS